MIIRGFFFFLQLAIFLLFDEKDCSIKQTLSREQTNELETLVERVMTPWTVAYPGFSCMLTKVHAKDVLLSALKSIPETKRDRITQEAQHLMRGAMHAGERIDVIDLLKGLPENECSSLVQNIKQLLEHFSCISSIPMVMRSVLRVPVNEQDAYVQSIKRLVSSDKNEDFLYSIMETLLDISADQRASITSSVETFHHHIRVQDLKGLMISFSKMTQEQREAFCLCCFGNGNRHVNLIKEREENR